MADQENARFADLETICKEMQQVARASPVHLGELTTIKYRRELEVDSNPVLVQLTLRLLGARKFWFLQMKHRDEDDLSDYVVNKLLAVFMPGEDPQEVPTSHVSTRQFLLEMP